MLSGVNWDTELPSEGKGWTRWIYSLQSIQLHATYILHTVTAQCLVNMSSVASNVDCSTKCALLHFNTVHYAVYYTVCYTVNYTVYYAVHYAVHYTVHYAVHYTVHCAVHFAVHYAHKLWSAQWIEEKDLVRHGLKGELLLWSTTHRFVEDQGLQNPMFLPVLWFRATEALRSKNHLKSFSPTHDFTEMQSKGNKLASLEATLVWNYNSLTRLIINYSQG